MYVCMYVCTGYVHVWWPHTQYMTCMYYVRHVLYAIRTTCTRTSTSTPVPVSVQYQYPGTCVHMYCTSTSTTTVVRSTCTRKILHVPSKVVHVPGTCNVVRDVHTVQVHIHTRITVPGYLGNWVQYWVMNPFSLQVSVQVLRTTCTHVHVRLDPRENWPIWPKFPHRATIKYDHVGSKFH